MLRTQSTTRSPYPYVPAPEIPKVLVERFDQAFAFRRRAVASSDRECIREMDFASQRLCQAVTDFRPYLNQQRISSVEVKLRSIADAITKIRHQDMAIVALEKMVVQTQPELSKTANHLIEIRKQVRQNASNKLRQLLRSLRPKALRLEFSCSASQITERAAPR